MVIKSVALYTTPRKVCSSIVQKDSCWFQWGLKQSHTRRVFTAARTIRVFAGMMKLKLHIISASAMGKYQLHLLDQRKMNCKKGKVCSWMCCPGCSWSEHTQISAWLIPAASKAAHPCPQRGGTRAWTWTMTKAVSTAGRGKWLCQR